MNWRLHLPLPTTRPPQVNLHPNIFSYLYDLVWHSTRVLVLFLVSIITFDGPDLGFGEHCYKSRKFMLVAVDYRRFQSFLLIAASTTAWAQDTKFEQQYFAVLCNKKRGKCMHLERSSLISTSQVPRSDVYPTGFEPLEMWPGSTRNEMSRAPPGWAKPEHG
jgi:hypothetical protein